MLSVSQLMAVWNGSNSVMQVSYEPHFVLYIVLLPFLESNSIPILTSEVDCSSVGVLFREQNNLSETLRTSVFGISSSAAGVYECNSSGSNMVEVSTTQVRVSIPGQNFSYKQLIYSPL